MNKTLTKLWEIRKTHFNLSLIVISSIFIQLICYKAGLHTFLIVFLNIHLGMAVSFVIIILLRQKLDETQSLRNYNAKFIFSIITIYFIIFAMYFYRTASHISAIYMIIDLVMAITIFLLLIISLTYEHKYIIELDNYIDLSDIKRFYLIFTRTIIVVTLPFMISMYLIFAYLVFFFEDGGV